MKRCVQCMPRQNRALDPGRQFLDAIKNGQSPKMIWLRSLERAGRHSPELANQLFSFIQAFAFDIGRHHGCRGFTNGTALAFDCDVFNPAIGDVYREPNAISAQRIKTLCLMTGRLKASPVTRLFVVIEYDFLIKLFRAHDVADYPKICLSEDLLQAKIFWTRRIAPAS
jgi:hypothetical protein